MPCYDHRTSDGSLEREREYQLLVRFACEVLTRMERKGVTVPASMATWWEAHKAHDIAEGRRTP